MARRAYYIFLSCFLLVATQADAVWLLAAGSDCSTLFGNMEQQRDTERGPLHRDCVQSRLAIVLRATQSKRRRFRGKSHGWKDIFDFISNTADGAVGVDPEQKIVLWNEAAEALFGLKPEVALGRFCYEVIAGRDEASAPVCRKGCLNLTMGLEGYRVPPYDLLLCTKAAREVLVNVSTVLVPSRWSELCVFVHLFRVVGRQNEMERLVQRLSGNMAKVAVPRESDPQPSPPPSPPSIDLTRREREVLRLLASGASNKVIATKLFISPSTARNHVHNILAKLGVHSRLEALTLALENGLLRADRLL